MRHMPVTVTNAKSVLIRHRQIDSWFVSRAHLNLYRGCTHNCAYCDGRYEGYHVEGDFGSDIIARQNAPMLLDAALNPHRKRNPLNSGFIMLGGGVSDSYQPAEKKLRLAEQCLEVILKWRQPVHILTKSTLVERDVTMLQKINKARAALVSVSFSTVDDSVARVFEPGCPPPSARREMMARLIDAGIPTGMFLLPVVPGISDTEAEIEKSVAAAAETGALFVVFGGMTLKPGRQQTHFANVIKEKYPKIFANYPRIYSNNPYGAASQLYYQRIEQRFVQAARRHRLYRRIPPAIYARVCTGHDRILVALSHLDYLQKACGDNQPFKTLAKTLRQTEDAPELLQYAGLSNEMKALLHNITVSDGQNCYDKYL